MLANLFAAHLTRFKLSWRRSGVIILHLGVILLMGGELLTGLFAVESRMMLQVGESRNFIDHSQKIELALTDEATHRTATIPQGMLTRGKTITSSELPVDVEVLERFKNTSPSGAVGGDDSDTIISVSGGRYHVIPATEGSGVKSDQPDDIPGVRLRLLKKGTQEVLAERIWSLWEYQNGPTLRQFMALPFRVTVDGRTFAIELRNERILKPYTIELLKFEHTKYAGTGMAKDYASTVRLVDPETGDDREVRIWMNHPLRHRGETFYQSGTIPGELVNGERKDTGTVLQVVKNPGWILPYASCIIVTLGLLIHFGISIVRFTGKTSIKHPANPSPSDLQGKVLEGPVESRQNAIEKYFPWAVIAILALYAGGKMSPKHEKYKEFDLTAFGSIPVLDSGRIKPLDSVARTSMLFISGRSEWDDNEGKTRPAIFWLLEVLAAGDPQASPIADYRVFRVDNEQVLAELNLEYRPGSYRYSWNEIRKSKSGDKFERELLAAQLREEKRAAGEKVPEEDRDLFHGKILELGRRLHAYEELALRKTPTLIPTEKGSAVWQTLNQIDTEAGRQFDEDARQEAMKELRQVLQEKGISLENMKPALQMALEQELERRTQIWIRRFGESERGKVNPAAGAFGKILSTYKENQPKGFVEAINTYTSDYVFPLNPEFRDTTKFEVAFNGAMPFINAGFMYLFAVVFMVLSWLGWRGPLRKTAIGVAVIALLLHAGGLFGRMYLMGRPLVFVTNLYSSGLMIGFASVAGCLVMERIFRNGIGLVVGATLGAATVKISHHLATDGSDTLGSLVAVLDTNFWLASHVTTVVLGYTATFVAGLIGMAFILQMLVRVIVQSFQTPEKLTAGEAVAYVAAVIGIMLIPYLYSSIWILMLTAEEFIPPGVSQFLSYLTLGVGILSGMGLVVVRILLWTDTSARKDRVPGVATILQNTALDTESMTKLGQMVYGVTCFATLLSFVGTVLGGIWADQSWGRFWGWDPKENGAVLIVIWNALILHARWCGLVKQRGMSILAMAGIMVTTWSWFGTNQLGVGLHNYGFNKTLAEGCMWTWITCMAVMAVGLVPFKYWRSFAGTGLPRAEAAPAAISSTAIPSNTRLERDQFRGKKGGKKQ
jgi:ABC-type transport system involved in cytochrome c biogenesis permease subunit